MWSLLVWPKVITLSGFYFTKVVVAGCCFLVSTVEACFIGLLGATLTFMAMMLMERIYWLDDPCAAFPVHGLSGVWVCFCTIIIRDFRLDPGKSSKMIIFGVLLPTLKSSNIFWGISAISWYWLEPKNQTTFAKLSLSESRHMVQWLLLKLERQNMFTICGWFNFLWSNKEVTTV